MQYRAKPVIVTAFEITEIRERYPNGQVAMTLSNGDQVEALPDMTARMSPQVNDYWVIQADGYTYLNPKKVFEAKYDSYLSVDEKKRQAPEVEKQFEYDSDKAGEGVKTIETKKKQTAEPELMTIGKQ